MRKWWAWLGIILAAGTGAGAVHAEYRGGTIRIGVRSCGGAFLDQPRGRLLL